jgi:hypothetical protein
MWNGISFGKDHLTECGFGNRMRGFISQGEAFNMGTSSEVNQWTLLRKWANVSSSLQSYLRIWFWSTFTKEWWYSLRRKLSFIWIRLRNDKMVIHFTSAICPTVGLFGNLLADVSTFMLIIGFSDPVWRMARRVIRHVPSGVCHIVLQWVEMGNSIISRVRDIYQQVSSEARQWICQSSCR